MTTTMSAEPGTEGPRPAPAGLPDPRIQPPTIAESGDPFAVVRVIDLVARLDRGVPIRLDDVVDRLNAAWTDWLSRRGHPARRSRSRTRAASTRGSSARPFAWPPSVARPWTSSHGVTGWRRVADMRPSTHLDADPAGRCACPWRARSR